MKSLIDIANANISSYQALFDQKTDAEKSKVAEINAGLSLFMNMGADALLGIIERRWKNKFELCAEANGISLEEFSSLPLNLQRGLMCKTMFNKYAIRRVDFSNRYKDGFKLNYLAPYITAKNSCYGVYCVTISLPLADTDVALKYDSLDHYYKDGDEYDEEACHKDLLPYSNIDLLLSDKFSVEFNNMEMREIKLAFEKDPDPIEIITVTQINLYSIKAVSMTLEEYKIIADLNKESDLPPADEEKIYIFNRLQTILSTHRIDVIYNNKASEAV